MTNVRRLSAGRRTPLIDELAEYVTLSDREIRRLHLSAVQADGTEYDKGRRIDVLTAVLERRGLKPKRRARKGPRS